MAPRSYGTLPTVENNDWEQGSSSPDDDTNTSSSIIITSENDKKAGRMKRAAKLAGILAVVVAVVELLGRRMSGGKSPFVMGIHSVVIGLRGSSDGGDGGHGTTKATTASTTNTNTNNNNGSFSGPAWLKSPQSLGLHSVERDNLQPSKAWGAALLSLENDGDSGHDSRRRRRRRPLPTNAWYLNLLSDQAGTPYNTEVSRVYTVPYMIDTVGRIPGLRIHWPTLQANPRNMQMVVDASNAVTLGAANANPHYQMAAAAATTDNHLSPLGLALEWTNTNGNTEQAAGGKTNKTAASGSPSSSSKMVAPIVRGMPFATMEYHNIVGGSSSSKSALIPTVLAGKVLASDPIVDNHSFSQKTKTTLTCGVLDAHDQVSEPGTSQVVQKELTLHFKGSDFTWMIFVSRPVRATCASAPDPESQASTPENAAIPKDVMFQLQLYDDFGVEMEKKEANEGPLIVRMALVNECTTGKSTIAAHCEKSRRMNDPEGYIEMLRKTVHLRPSATPKLELDFGDKDLLVDDTHTARIILDWDVTNTAEEEEKDLSTLSFSKDKEQEGEEDKAELIMFALPYQQNMLEAVNGTSSNTVLDDFCTPSFHGRTCLVKGKRWSLVEDLGPRASLSAARPPKAESMELLAHTLAKDIQYVLSDNLQRAAADTYFSGKVLARLGRVIAIANELKALASDPSDTCKTLYDQDLVDTEQCHAAAKAAQQVELPSDHQVQTALEMLRDAVEVWVNGLAEATYVYDETWGGLINCGCNYTVPKGKNGDEGICSNTAPYDCPAFTDVNVDFGNGWYNDHHYHYGYHIYAAAVVAHYDPDWALQWMDHIMLYIRDIANPSENDPYFPRFRHKDWYLGSSWASGLASFREIHGRNQESSSEAIAAYEGVALFGSAMERAVRHAMTTKKATATISNELLESLPSMAATAREIHQTGRLLMATELHATQRYWHVWNSTEHQNSYPATYAQPVVGMLYETMASFQTWFSGGDMASIGIQLLPFTPVAEARDDPVWAAHTFGAYNQSCASDPDFCVKNGWSVMLSGLEATIGQYDRAVEDALAIPDKVFSSDGGCGHSRTNLIWYIATRPAVITNTTTPTTTNATNTDHDTNSSTEPKELKNL